MHYLTYACAEAHAYTLLYFIQVMSESVASALEFLDNDNTQQTRLFIRMVDRFFDCLNVKGPLMAQWKRKESIVPYKTPQDPRFKVSHCCDVIHCTCTML